MKMKPIQPPTDRGLGHAQLARDCALRAIARKTLHKYVLERYTFLTFYSTHFTGHHLELHPVFIYQIGLR
jgi:hypothetical protein